MNTNLDTVEVECYFQLESSKAWLIRHKNTEAIWIPKSQITCSYRAGRSKYGTMTIPRWLADTHAMEYDVPIPASNYGKPVLLGLECPAVLPPPCKPDMLQKQLSAICCVGALRKMVKLGNGDPVVTYSDRKAALKEAESALSAYDSAYGGKS